MKKTVIVTGANGGIGLATCTHLSHEGYQVVALCRTQKEAQMLPYPAYACDLVNTEDIRATFEKIVADGHELFGLVNNAGIYLAKAWDEISEENFAQTFNINVTAPFILSRLFAQHLIARTQAGVIVDVSSASAHIGSVDIAYAGSKAAMVAMGKSLARALAVHNIRVVTLCPGPIETKMGDSIPTDRKQKYKENIPLKRFGHPEEVAATIAFALSDQAAYITGTTINVDGGLV
jgi:3-oxoacyl-[acyl-carrier protein] reductase